MKHRLAFMLLLLFSCRDIQRQKVSNQVKEWQGKEIVFPKEINFTMHGEKPLDFKIPDAEYKVLVYTDSIGCTNCKLSLGEWKEFICKADSLTDGKVPFLFFFHTKRQKDIINQLKAFKIDLPVCMDHNDQLNLLNKFPSDMQFQTFLIDRNNRVKVIGNPVNNSKIRDLYLDFIINVKRKEVSQGEYQRPEHALLR